MTDDIQELSNRLEGIEKRLGRIEGSMHDEELSSARAEVHLTYLKERFDKVDREIDDVQSNMKMTYQRLVWAVATALLLAVMDFIVGGGLILPYD